MGLPCGPDKSVAWRADELNAAEGMEGKNHLIKSSQEQTQGQFLPANDAGSANAAIEKLNPPPENNLLSAGDIRNGWAECACILWSKSSSWGELYIGILLFTGRRRKKKESVICHSSL